LHVRIHREDIVPALLQPAVDQIADRVVAVVARHADNGDALLTEEVMHLGIERCWSHRLLHIRGM
jgi:hypothetical protein